jgi:hypothetical protein
MLGYVKMNYKHTNFLVLFEIYSDYMPEEYIIFYQVIDEYEIEVIRILHERMDFKISCMKKLPLITPSIAKARA